MILIHWLKFLFLIFSFSSSYYIFPYNFFFKIIIIINYDSVFRIYDLHSYKFEEYFVLVVFPFLSLFLFRLFLFRLFFFLSSFFIISHLSFFPFPYFPLFSFPNWHHFLNLVCHFLRAPLPCSRTFCCPDHV